MSQKLEKFKYQFVVTIEKVVMQINFPCNFQVMAKKSNQPPLRRIEQKGPD